MLDLVDQSHLRALGPKVAAMRAETQPLVEIIRQHSAALQEHAANHAVAAFNRSHTEASHAMGRIGHRP